MHLISAFLGSLGLIGWIYLAVLHGRFWRPLTPDPSLEPESWPSVDIIVPARNEAELLPVCLTSLLAQDYPGDWRIILVDDHSNDDTGALAQKLSREKGSADRLTVLWAPELPQGWRGKVSAMQTGVAAGASEYVLFTDADIFHHRLNLRQLVARAIERKLDLTSQMVKLHCRTTAEMLLIPAFVYFFALIYPFARVNNPDRATAAAAGGIMLVRRKAIETIGGLKTISGALIDDCALAKCIKQKGGENGRGGRIELTLAQDIKSLRAYPDIRDVRDMVTRTAFTQLNYSTGILIATIFGMFVLFLLPPLLPLTNWSITAEVGMAAWIIMMITYLPTVLFYRPPFVWALTLPLAAVIYILATIDSARLYWQGKGGQWKDRTQAS